MSQVSLKKLAALSLLSSAAYAAILGVCTLMAAYTLGVFENPGPPSQRWGEKERQYMSSDLK